MVLREQIEKREYETLSAYAVKSAETKGRAYVEAKDDLRTDFQRDRDRIIHSKAFRRLIHKTQVFIAPEGDHYRTRLMHTLEVSQIARTISRAPALNEDLTEAIALGHDLGHTPFGHNGEAELNVKHPRGFSHNVQSLRVVDVIERNDAGRTMNLCDEVRDGIVNHSGPHMPYTLEGRVVRLSDRIAYINHDIDDAVRSGVISQSDLPRECIDYLGETHGKRIETLVMDIIKTSDGRNTVQQSRDAAYYMNELRNFMFRNVYKSPKVISDDKIEKIRSIIFSLYDYYLENPDLLPAEERFLLGQDDDYELVKDHIAGMTDRYAVNKYVEIFRPENWSF
ncbi:MAG: deoxyguanosinetriphosphate triphosphohydrolase [Firmicutes bacterium]|nr:deoxyguanosinetriphosphate triphosphohydrolase [Bacillota bacterium]